jgi:alpha-beta hydrolase superfamily lysophospholipase
MISPPSVTYRAVKLRTSDDLILTGRLFGTGTTGVVLAHQVDDDQSDWFPFAGTLAASGYQVLTFDFRGYCGGGGCSEGDGDDYKFWKDVVAAVGVLQRRGAEKVVLIGASIGGEACIQAARHLEGGIDGLVTLSASEGLTQDANATRHDVEATIVPKLFIAAEGDREFASYASDLYRFARDPKQLSILSAVGHGVNLFITQSARDRTPALILEFLSTLPA